MIVSRKHKFIFGGIGRSAATSLHKALQKYNRYSVRKDVKENFSSAVFQVKPDKKGPCRKHAPFEVAEAYVPGFETYFKFCIFRNPWDLAVSKYFYHGGPRCRHRNGYGGVPVCKNAREKSFLEWVRMPGHLDLVYQVPLRNFKEFVSNKAGKVLVDRIYQFPYLDVCRRDLEDRIGEKINLPHLNKTKHSNYAEYYKGDAEAIGIVRKQFAWGIEQFDFKFGEISSTVWVRP